MKDVHRDKSHVEKYNGIISKVKFSRLPFLLRIIYRSKLVFGVHGDNFGTGPGVLRESSSPLRQLRRQKSFSGLKRN